MHISYVKFIWTTRRGSRLDHVSWKYTEQIRKPCQHIPLDFPQILLKNSNIFFLLFFFGFSVFFSFFFFWFVCVFFLNKNIYSKRHWTMRAGKWKKTFTRLISENMTFFGLINLTKSWFTSIYSPIINWN